MELLSNEVSRLRLENKEKTISIEKMVRIIKGIHSLSYLPSYFLAHFLTHFLTYFLTHLLTCLLISVKKMKII